MTEVKRFKRTLKGSKIDISPLQQLALEGDRWSLDKAREAFGRHAKLVLGGLVTQGLMYSQGAAMWRRTTLGREALTALKGAAKKKNGK